MRHTICAVAGSPPEGWEDPPDGSPPGCSYAATRSTPPKFVDVFGSWESAELSQLEAADLLGVGERMFGRWRRCYDEGGEAGLLDRRIGQASGKRLPRFHGAASPRAPGTGPSVRLELQLD